MQSQQPIHLVISNYNTDPRYLIPLGDSYFIYDKSDNPYFKDLIPSFTSNFKFTHNPGHNLCDILDYKSTSKFKTTRSLGGFDNNGSGIVHFTSGLWRSTNAVSSIKLYPQQGGIFAQYTSIALYGIKGA